MQTISLKKQIIAKSIIIIYLSIYFYISLGLFSKKTFIIYGFSVLEVNITFCVAYEIKIVMK